MFKGGGGRRRSKAVEAVFTGNLTKSRWPWSSDLEILYSAFEKKKEKKRKERREEKKRKEKKRKEKKREKKRKEN